MIPSRRPWTDLRCKNFESSFCEPSADPRSDQGLLYAQLRRSPAGLEAALRNMRIRTAPSPHRRNLLILVDQFEEIFRHHERKDPEEAYAFVSMLLHSTTIGTSNVYVLMTIGSDWLGK